MEERKGGSREAGREQGNFVRFCAKMYALPYAPFSPFRAERYLPTARK